MTDSKNLVSGIGGLFFRAHDPHMMGEWYETHFGINNMEGGTVWRQQEGPTVFAPFQRDTDYFGRDTQKFMVNFRVTDMEALLKKLEAGGVRIDKKRQEDAIGKFAWVFDPEGNKIELWEPSAECK